MIYTVTPGDTLSGIAARFRLSIDGLGLFEINKERLSSGNPNLIFPGETIVIPDGIEERIYENNFPTLSINPPNRLAININNVFYRQIIDYSMSESVENLCSEMSCSFSFDEETIGFTNNSLFYLSVGTTPIQSGYFEKINHSFSISDRKLDISGRSRGLDVVDSVNISGTTVFRNQSLLSILNTLCSPFNISVQAREPTSIVDIFKIDPGQGIFEAIDKNVKKQGFLFSQDEFGNIILFKKGRDTFETLTEREMISISINRDYSQIFQKYRVLGQNKNTVNAQATVIDQEVDRPRQKTIISDEQMTNKEALQRAQWERSISRARSETISIEIEGWRRPNGELWRAGDIIRIVYPDARLDNRYFIKSLSRNKSTNGFKSTLEVVRENAYTNNLAI